MSIHHLEVTVAHHGDDEFYMLGRIMPKSGGWVMALNAAMVADVTHEVPPEPLFHALPNEPCNVDGPAICPEFCVVIDACDDDGDIVDDKEVSVEVADALLDGEFAERLAAARQNMDDYYEYERRRPAGVSGLDWLMRLAQERLGA